MATFGNVPLRVLPAILLFLGTFASYVTRVSINIAIITMTENATEICTERSATARYEL